MLVSNMMAPNRTTKDRTASRFFSRRKLFMELIAAGENSSRALYERRLIRPKSATRVLSIVRYAGNSDGVPRHPVKVEHWEVSMGTDFRSLGSAVIIMKMNNHIRLALVLLLAVMAAGNVAAQDRSSGSIKGKVRVETGSPSGVSVIVRQNDREVARGVTDRKGEFLISSLAPGRYGVTLRKAGLSVGTIEEIDVKAGKTRSLGDRLVLSVDEGSIAFIRGSVFNQDDRSVPNVRIELAKIEADGTVRKIDGRVTNEIGAFVFRLTPDAAKYRITAKANGVAPVSKDVEVDGAAVYRIALSIKPAGK